MTELADFTKFVTDEQSAAIYGKWASQNPGELARWFAFRDAVFAGQRPGLPVMTTPYGRGLIDAGAEYLDATAVSPPPPPPPPVGSYDTVVPTLTYAPVAAASPTNYTSLSSFLAALAALQPGQWIRGVGLGAIPGSFTWSNILSSPGRVSFDSGCHFTGTPVPASPNTGNWTAAIYIPTATNLQLVFEQGSTVVNPGGTGILLHGGNGVVIDGFVTHDCGHDGFAAFPASDGSQIAGCFFRGEAYNIGLTLAFDDHAEQGTGLHCMNLADAAPYPFHDNVVAIYGHDCLHAGGAVVEIGVDTNPVPYSNTIYVKAANMLMQAKQQTAGNAVNLWGQSGMHDIDFAIVEATNMMGRAVDCQGVYGSGNFTNVAVRHGRAHLCSQNPNLASLEGSTNPWDTRHGVVYSSDVLVV